MSSPTPSDDDVRRGAYGALGYFRRRLANQIPLSDAERVHLSNLLEAVEEHMENMYRIIGDV